MLSWIEHEKSFVTSGPDSVIWAFAIYLKKLTPIMVMFIFEAAALASRRDMVMSFQQQRWHRSRQRQQW